MFKAGRFVLLHVGFQEGMEKEEEGYVTSWDTWEECEVVWNTNGLFPVGFRLYDNETGRVWHPGSRYEWEDAQT